MPQLVERRLDPLGQDREVRGVRPVGGLAFGLGADRTNTPDLAVLAEGIQESFDELRHAARPRRRTTVRR